MPAVEQESRAPRPEGVLRRFSGTRLSRALPGDRDPVEAARSFFRPLVLSLLTAAVVATSLAGANPDALRVAGVSVAVFAVVADLGRKRWIVGVAAVVASWWLAVLAARYVPHVFNPAPSVGQAIGGAAVFGTPYRGVQVAALLSVAVPCLFAIMAFAASSRRSSGSFTGSGSRASDAGTDEPSRRWLILWASVAVVTFTLVPDLRAYIHAASKPVSYSWDTANLTAWDGFVRWGLTPMKDFFYPYGLQWLYGLRSFGPTFQWVAEAATLALAAWSLWRLSGRHTVRVLACLVALVLVAPWSGIWRYLPALLVATTYAAVGPLQHPRLVRRHLALFAACMLALLLEPELLVYGLAGMVLVVLGEIVSRRLLWHSRRLAACVAVDAVPVLAAVLVIFLIWLAMGTTGGWSRFLGGFTAISAADSRDERLLGPLGLIVMHPNAYTLSAAIPAVLATLGFLWAGRESRESHGVAAVLLGASGVALVMLLKSFVRGIPDEVIGVCVVPLLWSVILAWQRDSLVRAVAAGAALGALLILVSGNPFDYLGRALASPVRAVRSLEVVFDRGARARAAGAWFDPARFSDWPDLTVADEYMQTVRVPTAPPFAIFGDSQLTYVLLHQRPPYHIDLYDAAPISDQHLMLRLLNRRQPPFMIWQETVTQDGIPYYVRNPLLFTWMVAHYVPAGAYPSVDILQRRASGKRIATAFWRSRLGAIEDLGYIPSYSTAASSRPCSGGSGCVSYALVKRRGNEMNAVAQVAVVDRGLTYRIVLHARSGVDSYPVRLDRLWFWPLLGSSPTFRILTPGFTVDRVGFRTGDNLY